MKFVELYETQNNGSQRVVAVCTLADTGVLCTGDEVLVENLAQDGIWDDSQTPPQKVFPQDGIRFLERLRFAFKSGYLNASEVKEK